MHRGEIREDKASHWKCYLLPEILSILKTGLILYKEKGIMTQAIVTLVYATDFYWKQQDIWTHLACASRVFPTYTLNRGVKT